MGFWRFGREPADTELISRVVNARISDGAIVRGKLTIHFLEPQTAKGANGAADRCAALAEALLRESEDHRAVLGADTEVTARLLPRYPADLPPIRGLELAALHVVSAASHSPIRRHPVEGGAEGTGTPPPPAVGSASPAAAPWPSSIPPPPSPRVAEAPAAPAADPAATEPVAGGVSGKPVTEVVAGEVSGKPSPEPVAGEVSGKPVTEVGLGGVAVKVAPGHAAGEARSVAAPKPSVTPSPPSVAPNAGPARRRSTGSMRTSSLLLPTGSPPSAIAAYLGPMVRESASRLLIGMLRAHDLITVRKVTIDAGSAEMLANLVPVTQAPTGGYDVVRVAEIARWQVVLGEDVMKALTHEVDVAAAFLAYHEMEKAEVSQKLALEVLEALHDADAPEAVSPVAELGRYLDALEPPLELVVKHLTAVVGGPEEPASIAIALAPLLSITQEDLRMAAAIVKLAC